MGVIAKYKFNQNTYENFIPEFNSEFTDYTTTDEIDTDGYTVRTIESNSLPTLMRFGAGTQTDREKSLLEIYECNTESVTNMAYMFNNCSSLTLLDVSNFDTSSTTSMISMFDNCSSLTSLNASNFNTSKVNNMYAMFRNCSSLTSLNASNFDTSQVTNMQEMFSKCISLTSLDVSNFDTSKVTKMQGMFNNCSLLTSLDVSNFNTSQVTNMSSMFQNCSSLTSLDVSNFDTSQVTNMNSMFSNCQSLTSLDLSSFNTSKVTNMGGMFRDCSSLTSLDLSNFNTSQVSYMQVMFNNCSSLTSLDLSNFNTSQATNMNSMFSNCQSLTSLDLSSFNTSKVTNMGGMFRDCSSLTSLDLSNFNTSQTIDMNTMFFNCSSLTLLDLSNFDTSNVTNISSMFVEAKNPVDIGMIYCNSDTINKISELITTNTSIYYMDAKLEDLTKKSNITYKEYKMNILESDEEIELCRIGDVYDKLNLLTGELTQYIGNITLKGEEGWEQSQPNINANVICDRFKLSKRDMKYQTQKIISNIPIYTNGHNAYNINEVCIDTHGLSDFYLYIPRNLYGGVIGEVPNINKLKIYLQNNPITVQYELATPIIKTIKLKGKPSINWQGDTYLHLENNTLYPQLDCEVESINYYEIPKLKANTLYTLQYVGEPTQCIFGGLTYETENNMILTSGSSDNLLYFDKEVRKVILIEGDVRDRNFDYFEGIESLGAVEIITHKTNMPIFAKGGRK